MAYDMDIFGGCDGLFICLATWLNSVTNGMFWSLFLIAFGVILFMATFNFGVNRSFGVATIGVAFMSLILVQASLIPQYIFTICLLVSLAGIVAMIIGQR